jgi:hypothetical protein
MQRIRELLKKGTAATLFAVMLVASFGVTLLDAHAIGAEPHWDAPQGAACSPYDHNHSLCIFLRATPQLTAAPAVLVARRPSETTTRPVEAGAPVQHGGLEVVRSRSPPV